MCLDKVTYYIQAFSVSFFKLFTTVTLTFHSITFVENTSLDVTGSLVCKQTAVVSYFVYIFIFCVLEWFFCFFVEVIISLAPLITKLALIRLLIFFQIKIHMFEEEI